MSGRISWTKEDRKRSKAEKKPLFVLGFDSRESEAGGGLLTYSGVGDQALVDDITALMKKHLAREKT